MQGWEGGREELLRTLVLDRASGESRQPDAPGRDFGGVGGLGLPIWVLDVTLVA